MNDWRDVQDKNFDALVRESAGGAAYQLILVPAWGVRQLMTDPVTNNVVLQAIAQWSRMVDAAQHDDYVPACAACAATIAQGDVAGWFVCVPEQAAGKTGLSGVFCRTCYDRGPAVVFELIRAALGDEFGEVHTIH